MIHIGKRTTLTTLCGKPVKRRWWVEAAHVRVGTIGPLTVGQRVEPEGADCKQCLNAASGDVPARGQR